MPAPRGGPLALTVDAIRPGTTVRYYYRTGDSLAAVIERTEDTVTFVGNDCNATVAHERIDQLLSDGRLQIVLG